MSWGSDTRRRAHCLVAFKSLGRDPTKLGCRPHKRVVSCCCCWYVRELEGADECRRLLLLRNRTCSGDAGRNRKQTGRSKSVLSSSFTPWLPLVPCWWSLMGRQLTEEKWNCILSPASPGVRTASRLARVTGSSTASLQFSLAACVNNLRNVYTLWPSNSSSRNTS